MHHIFRPHLWQYLWHCACFFFPFFFFFFTASHRDWQLKCDKRPTEAQDLPFFCAPDGFHLCLDCVGTKKSVPLLAGISAFIFCRGKMQHNIPTITQTLNYQGRQCPGTTSLISRSPAGWQLSHQWGTWSMFTVGQVSWDKILEDLWTVEG